MVLLKKCISIFCSIAIICSLMAFNVSAANYLDTPWSANFDPDQGGFPDWSDIYKVLDPENYPEYGRSMLMTSWYRDVPYFNGVLDKAAGVYCFSFEVYATSESSNISTMLSKELYDPSWSLFDLIYDFSDGTMRYYVPDKTSTSKTNQVTSIEKLAAKTWHQFDYIINLNDMTVSCYVNGKPAYTKDVPYNTADAIKTGTYSPVGFVGSGSEVYWDNLEAGPYSENSFDAKSGSLAGLPEGVTSVDIAFEHSVYAATLTSERISAKKYSSDDLLMQNGTPLEISVSNAKARSVTVDIGEPVQGGCFYSLSMDNVVDINKGGFKEKTKVFMVGAEKTETVVDDTFDDYTGGTPEGYSCWKSVNGVPASFDGSEGLKMFDSADSATAPDEVYKDYAPFKTTFNAFNESFSDIRMDKGLMFRFVDTNTGVGRKIPLSSNNGKIKISFDAARNCGTDDGFNHTNMYFWDATNNKKVDIIRFSYTDGNLNYYNNGVQTEYPNGNWIYYFGYNRNNSITLDFDIDEENNNAKLHWSAKPSTAQEKYNRDISVTQDFNVPSLKDIDFESGEVYFIIERDDVPWNQSTHYIDNFKVEHTGFIGGSRLAGGITFTDYKGYSAEMENGKVSPTVSKINIPLAGIKESDISVSFTGQSFTPGFSGIYDKDKKLYTLLVDGCLEPNETYTLTVGDFVSNGAALTFETSDGIFDAENLQIVDGNGAAVNSIAGMPSEIALSADIMNTTEDRNVYFVITTYSGSEMKQIFVQRFNAQKGISKKISTGTVTPDMTGVDSVRAHLWNSLNKNLPLCDMTEIK